MSWRDPFLDALEPVLAKFRYSRARAEALVTLRAIRLAADLETCEAIMRGDRIPKSRVVPEWAKAYGLR